jgi:hypothetical protein
MGTGRSVTSIYECMKAFMSLRREQVWLAQSPGGLQQCVWDIIVLAATSADRAPSQTEEAEGAASRRAVADFWSRLYEFADLGEPRKGWAAAGATHPILKVTR